MRSVSKVAGLTLVALLALYDGASGQNLAFSLFERYLEPLRQQAGIPGLSAAIVQNGRIVWARGFGHRDVEASLPALPDTPYLVDGLTQIFTATLLLQCAERGELQVDDPIGKWIPQAAGAGTTLRQLLAHASSTPLRFRYDPDRFALLRAPIEACSDEPYRKVLAREILDRLAMADSVPGRNVSTTPVELRQLFDGAVMDRYARTLQRLATPYKVDRRGRAIPGDYPDGGIDGAQGLIASARDLAQFDAALDRGVLLRPETLAASWNNASAGSVPLPTGLGWFVQAYEGEPLVWHFGSAPDAFSSLILKVPRRRLTLILLANSDRLSVPFSLAEGDVTSSLFARTFLRLFL